MTEPVPIVSLDAADDVQHVGGKAINLSRLLRAGFRVPGGFVVTTQGFRAATLEGGAGRAHVEQAIRDAYDAMARTDGRPPAVAVRSSATAEDMAGASMAGQYETFLDITGADAVVEAVHKCWQSISTPRTQAYLRQHGIDPANVAMAVVVQRLIPSRIAGVMFTANPRTGNENEILIEASWGLGEAVVSGLVQPDTILLDKQNGAIKSYVVGSKEIRIEPGDHEHQKVPPAMAAGKCLSEGQLRELHGLALRAEAHFEGPQDTEWAFAGEGDGTLYLLQSRAVTTLASMKARDAVIQETRQSVRAWKSQGRGDWARHNLGETLPHPTPLSWSVLQRFMTPAGGFGAMYRMAGYEPSAALGTDGFLDLIAGRIYMDLARAPEMFFPHFPFRYDGELLRATPSAAQAAPTLPAGSLLAIMRTGRRLARAGRQLERLAETFDAQLDGAVIQEFRRWVAEESQRDLATLPPQAWIKLWQAREAKIMDDFAPKSLLPSLICGLALENLKAFLAPHAWNEDAEELANMLAAGGPPDATLRSNEALFRVANGTVALSAWIEENGHRAPEEFDLAAPRWRERPAAARALAQHLVNGADPQLEHQQRTREADTRAAAMKQSLTAGEQKQLDRHISLARRYLRFREDGKHELMRGYELLRHMVIDAGRRLGISPPDVCLLAFRELADAISGNIKAGDLSSLLQSRRARRTAEAGLSLPDFIAAGDIDTLGELHMVSHGDRLDAFPLSTGAATGPVRIVASPETAGDLGGGYILVCRSTDPSWTPLFVNAAGIVLECGGSLSHGAVVAREMAKPAVVLPNATRILAESQIIGVDGTQGAVHLAADGREAKDSADSGPSPSDTRIAPERVPPVAGSREKASAKLRNVFVLFWLIYLAIVFLMPQSGLREISLAALDKILWPCFRTLGAIATVAIIAGSLAVLSMLGQWALTDVVRLREAKRRALALKKEAAKMPADSPRVKKIRSLTAPVQSRLAMAAFVPLAVLLGPMVMSFLWLPERIDPASANPAPGSTAIITAVVDPEYSGPVTLTPESAMRAPPMIQNAAAIRATLEHLKDQLSEAIAATGATTRPPDALPPSIRSQMLRTGKSPAALLADLRAFLAGPMPDQAFTWQLPTPGGADSALWHISVNAGAGAPLSAPLVLGNAAPPPLSIQTDEKGNRIEVIAAAASGPLRSVRIRFSDPHRPPPAAFFAPLTFLHWDYDFGWLGIYLLAYLPAFYIARLLLRIP